MPTAHYRPFVALMHGPFLIVALFAIVLGLAIWFQIFRKAGYSGFLCLLVVIPIVNLLTMIWFAFLARWPAQPPARS